MDQGSSPHLPVGSLATNKFHGGNGSLPIGVIGEDNAWIGIDDRDDSPGSQIAQELAATASQQDASEQNSLEFGRAGLPSIEEEIAASHAHAHPYKPPQVRDQSDEDEDMLDPDSLALIDRLASEHPSSPGKSASPPARRPSSSTYSDNVSSDTEEARGELDPTPEPDSLRNPPVDSSDAALPPNTIEELRAQRAANFDTTELDSFLFKQAQPQSEEQPTNKELLSTQIWGHIDPRVAWPKRMTEEERQEKIKEIEARGGKKANYGKILTAQVRKERAEKGWNIHQTSEWRSEEECKEMDRRLEELFGTEGLGNCVPGIQNGRLVMIEQLEPEEPQTGPGRRKKRREPKIYPVMGGQ
ncbi:hypothetical protein N431DRAFT_328217 [Stipitochalara longipes BDJ]|nr:hypothetical protein N431DRAFT_328217 [Stipitochalara longipes BDJ]